MRFISFIILCLFTISSKAQIDTIRIEKLDAIGGIQTLKEFTFKAIDKFGTITKGDVCKEVFAIDKENRKTNYSYLFDKHGNQLGKTEFRDISSVESNIIYTYQSGAIVESNEEIIFSDLTLKIKEIFKYNNKKLLSSLSKYRNGRIFNKYLYEYDDKDILVNEKQVGSDGAISNSKSFEYRYFGNKLIFRKEIDSEHGISIKEFEYDSIGRIRIKKVNYNNDFIRKIQYSYNKLNLPNTEHEVDEADDLIVKTVYDYDSLGRVIDECQIFHSNNRKSSKKYSYNENMRIEKFNTIKYESEKEENEYTYDYTFDNLGNWIKIIELRNTIPTLIRERTIVYY